jgi:hypothetical protein
MSTRVSMSYTWFSISSSDGLMGSGCCRAVSAIAVWQREPRAAIEIATMHNAMLHIARPIHSLARPTPVSAPLCRVGGGMLVIRLAPAPLASAVASRFNELKIALRPEGWAQMPPVWGVNWRRWAIARRKNQPASELWAWCCVRSWFWI